MSSIDALQAWLALEHEAVWLYSVIGGRIRSLDASAVDAWNAHRDVRDSLSDEIRSLGGEPVGTAMTYPGATLSSQRAARRAAQSVENQIAAACVSVLDDPVERSLALDGLRAAAQRATTWGAAATAFPGLVT